MTSSSPGRVVLITGAAGALGRHVAAHFLAQSARLALLDQSLDGLKAAFPTLVGQAQHRLLSADVTSTDSTAQAVSQIVAACGGIDVCVHVAGGFDMGPGVHQLSRDKWDRMMELNAWSFIALTHSVVPAMQSRGGGRIVAVTARAAAKGQAAMGAYCAAKSALQRLVESLSAEVKAQGINVNSVAPSIIDTPANRADMPQADPGLWVPPAQLAETIGFLASPAAAAIHGQHLTVDGLV